MTNGYIYLASPYTDASADVMEARFNAVCYIAGKLMAQGLAVFSPIAHTHPIAVRCDLPRDWEFWQRYDRAMLVGASKVIVAKLPGWERSKGVAAEVAIAGELGIPVEYIYVQSGDLRIG